MSNRVTEAALAVLKEYELRMKLEQKGTPYAATFELKIRGFSANSEALDEVTSALHVLGKDIKIRTQTTDTCTELVVTEAYPSNKDLRLNPPEKHPVGALAAQLANHNVQFPGSDHWKSKRLGA